MEDNERLKYDEDTVDTMRVPVYAYAAKSPWAHPKWLIFACFEVGRAPLLSENDGHVHCTHSNLRGMGTITITYTIWEPGLLFQLVFFSSTAT